MAALLHPWAATHHGCTATKLIPPLSVAELPEFKPDYPLYDYPMATIRVPHLIKEIIGVVVFLWCIKFCLGLLALAFAAKYGKMLVQHQQGRARAQPGASGVSSSSHAAANGLSDKMK
jgi:hypothetical protein